MGAKWNEWDTSVSFVASIGAKFGETALLDFSLNWE